MSAPCLDPFHEECLSLAQAARRLPRLRGARPPHPSTLFRWGTEGRRSKSGKVVRLEIVKVGGTNCTSMEALGRFFERLNDSQPIAALQAECEPPYEKQAAVAKQILAQRGLMKRRTR